MKCFFIGWRPQAYALGALITLVSAQGVYSEEKTPSADVKATVQIVSEIEFIGNTLNSSRSLERKIKTKRKKPFDKKKLQDDVKILFETGYFDDVEVSLSDLKKTDRKKRALIKIYFRVKERPVIKRIDYKGNKKIRSTSFEDKVQSKEDESFDRFKAALDERAILEYYRDEGYANAVVEHFTSIDEKKKKLILTFFIMEGERVLVKSVTIKGTKRYSQYKIRRKMETRRKKVFKEEVLGLDRKRIEVFYKNKGHWDVEVSTPSVKIDKELNKAEVELYVQEGPRYKVGKITTGESTLFTQKELNKAIVLKLRRPFVQTKLDQSVSNISDLYADKGYLRTDVLYEPTRHPEEGLIDFHFSFKENTVVYVDGVYIDGNTYTKEHVIKREVLLKPGDIFSAGRMRRSVEKIYNLGFLDDVQVDVQQPRDPDRADLIFTVKEGKPGILSAGAGFSSVDRFVGTLQIQHTNLFGLAQRLNMTYEFGGRRQNFDISWTDPWFLGYPMSGSLSFFNTTRRRDYAGQSNAFQEKRRGIGGRLGPRISETVGILFGYTIQTNEVFGVDPSIKEDLFPTFGIPKEEAAATDAVRQVKSSFLFEVAQDTRDNRFDATKGQRSAVSVEVAGGPFGGDIHYYKPQVTSSLFIPTFWRFVLAFNGRIAWVNKFSPSKDVSSSERFFLGGPDDIRGYDNNSIIPRVFERNEFGIEEVSQIPGRIMSIFNVEYKFPIVRERNRTIFQGAFFLDVGGTWLRTDDIDFTTGGLDKRLKAGVGFGFRFKTPVFPIRLDFAIPLNPRDTDTSRQGDSRSLQPYFTIGNIF